MREIKRVALIGLGAIGCYFAGGLYEQLGENFRVIAGGARAERLKKQGVEINGKHFFFPVTNPASRGEPADLVIVCVKEPALDAAIEDIRGQVGPDTILLSALNGLDSEERLAAVFGEEKVLYCMMQLASLMQDGRCSFNAANGRVVFGEKENRTLSGRVRAVAALFSACGLRYKIEEDMLHALWFKFMVNIGGNMTCAVLHLTYGQLVASPDAMWLWEKAMREVQQVAARKGIIITDEELEWQRGRMYTLEKDGRPSTVQDLEQGRPIELETFSGKMVRLGRELGVPVPVNEVYYHALKVLSSRPRY